MPKLPLLSGQETIDILAKHFGFSVVSQKGSHVKLRKSVAGKTITTIVPNHRELARGTLRGVLDLGEISVDEFIKFV